MEDLPPEHLSMDPPFTQMFLADSAFILSPAMLLIQKVGAPPPLVKFTDADLPRSHWRQLQVLVDRFWTCWKREGAQDY